MRINAQSKFLRYLQKANVYLDIDYNHCCPPDTPSFNRDRISLHRIFDDFVKEHDDYDMRMTNRQKGWYHTNIKTMLCKMIVLAETGLNKELGKQLIRCLKKMLEISNEQILELIPE